MKVDWNVVCSAVTAIAAIVALAVSVAQIRLSNKQQLFDRRLHLWIKARGLMMLCADNRSLLEGKADGPEFGNDFVFQIMTNNTLLSGIGPAVGHVLEQDWQLRLLTKLEELKEMAFEAEMVFRGRSAKVLSSFIKDYSSLLMSMYRYQAMLRYLRKVSEQYHYDMDKAISAVDEERQRADLYKAREELLGSFDELTPHMVETIIKQCSLA